MSWCVSVCLHKVSRDADTWPEAACPNTALLLYIWHLGRALSSLAPKLTIQDGCSLEKRREGEREMCADGEMGMQWNRTAAVNTFPEGGVEVDKQAFCKECCLGFAEVCT